ncbi:MAG: hypothetical protein UU87_C0003G0077 [Parcubacteria group bacterium GW2011_GWA2_42_11]|nr:MAG: hypothetical protein UU87_C0003G0077 [Parcubacteria group bacterium GW2011_GWA2_42_11]
MARDLSSLSLEQLLDSLEASARGFAATKSIEGFSKMLSFGSDGEAAVEGKKAARTLAEDMQDHVNAIKAEIIRRFEELKKD